MLGCTLHLPDYLARLNQEVDKLDQSAIQRLADHIMDAFESNRTIFVIGNGGSALTASHIAEDLGKSCLPEKCLSDESRKRVKVLSLTDNVGWLLALGNDVGYDQIFVQQLMNFGAAGDVLIAISGSGNSSNVIKAVDWANRHGLLTYGFSGYNGGELKRIQKDGLHVDLDDMGMVEGLHLCVWHWVLNDVHARINRVGRFAG